MKVFILLQSLIRRSFKNKYSILIYTIIPIIGIIIPIIISSNNDSKLNVSVIDNDKSNVSEFLKDELKKQYQYLEEKDSEVGKDKIINGQLNLLIIIPNDFEKNIISDVKTNIEFIYINESKDIYIIQQRMNTDIDNVKKMLKAVNGDEKSFKDIFKNIVNMDYKINLKSVKNDKNNFSIESLGFIILFMMIITNSSLSSIIKDRNNNVHKRLLYANIKSREYIIAQILWSFILAIFQSITIVVFMEITHINIFLSYFELIFIIIIIWSVAVSFSIFSISFCETEEQLSVVNTIIVFPTCMISGCLWPIKIMKKRIQKIAFIFPQRHIIMLMEQLQGQENIHVIMLNLAFIILFSSLLLVLGVIRIENNSFKEII